MSWRLMKSRQVIGPHCLQCPDVISPKLLWWDPSELTRQYLVKKSNAICLRDYADLNLTDSTVLVNSSMLP